MDNSIPTIFWVLIKNNYNPTTYSGPGTREGETTESVNNHACIPGAARNGLPGVISVWDCVNWRGEVSFKQAAQKYDKYNDKYTRVKSFPARQNDSLYSHDDSSCSHT